MATEQTFIKVSLYMLCTLKLCLYWHFKARGMKSFFLEVMEVMFLVCHSSGISITCPRSNVQKS